MLVFLFVVVMRRRVTCKLTGLKLNIHTRRIPSYLQNIQRLEFGSLAWGVRVRHYIALCILTDFDCYTYRVGSVWHSNSHRCHSIRQELDSIQHTDGRTKLYYWIIELVLFSLSRFVVLLYCPSAVHVLRAMCFINATFGINW